MTPGGLISHRYQEGSYDRLTVADVAAQPEIDEETLSQAMVRLGPDWQSGASGLLSLVDRMTYPNNFGISNPGLAKRYALGELRPPVEYDAVGYRILRMLHIKPEMLEPVEDADLQARFVNRAGRLARAELFIHAWHRSQVLLPDGYFTASAAPDPNADKAVDNLLALRTHPETQIFYKYLSPSGYINES
jgi:hypothetical protein